MVQLFESLRRAKRWTAVGGRSSQSTNGPLAASPLPCPAARLVSIYFSCFVHVGSIGYRSVSSNGTGNWNKFVIRRVFPGLRGRNQAVFTRLPPVLDVWAGFHDQEVALKAPRFGIAWVMVFVAVAAINFAAVRLELDHHTEFGEMLVLGALPMASVLAVGLLFGLRRPDRRPCLFGFTLFGAMALVFSVILNVFFREATLVPYVSLFLEPLWSIIGLDRSVVWIPAAYSIAVGVFTLPQVAFALLGGFLFRKFKITITRR